MKYLLALLLLSLSTQSFSVVIPPPYTLSSPLVACSGSSTLVSSTVAGRLANLADGSVVAFSTQPGRPGTTVFTFAPTVPYGSFPLGVQITYTGSLDGSQTFCVPTTMAVGFPAPVEAACGLPSGAKELTAVGEVTAVGFNSVTIGTTVITIPTCLSANAIEWNRKLKSFVIGDSVEWFGYQTAQGIVLTLAYVN